MCRVEHARQVTRNVFVSAELNAGDLAEEFIVSPPSARPPTAEFHLYYGSVVVGQEAIQY